MVDQKAVRNFASQQIGNFHNARLERLQTLDLKTLLKKKNPYLFRAKNILTADQLLQGVLDAFLSSSEEELFGQFLERLAVFVSELSFGGRKSSAEGLDLEFDRDGTRYVISIKSGPNWGNSSQQKRLQDNFRRALAVQKQARSNIHIQPVLGFCYGKVRTIDNGLFIKIAGQNFWTFLSDDPDLYIDIVEPIGYQARKHNEDFVEKRAALQNRFALQFIQEFCDINGNIDWHRLVAFNSGNLTNQP